MILAVNMVGSSIYTLLALIAIVTQNCPWTFAKPSPRGHHKSRHSNTNINTNINTFHKSRRLYEAMARAASESPDDKGSDGKSVQTAVIASAAADAAKIVTREMAKKLGDSTADAVATAVVKVLTEEGDKKNEKQDVDETSVNTKRSSRMFNDAFARLWYRSDASSPPDDDEPSEVEEQTIVEKILENDQPSFNKELQAKELHWIEGDGVQFPINSDTDKKEAAAESNRMYRRFLKYSDPWENQHRRSATSRRSSGRRMRYRQH